MVKSHKPLFWGPFAGGGMIAALIVPAMILISGLAVPLGLMPADVMAYDRMVAFFGNWLVKLAFFGIVFLLLLHSVHRFRVTLQDFGLRADVPVSVVLYIAAALGTLATAWALVAI